MTSAEHELDAFAESIHAALALQPTPAMLERRSARRARRRAWWAARWPQIGNAVIWCFMGIVAVWTVVDIVGDRT